MTQVAILRVFLTVYGGLPYTLWILPHIINTYQIAFISTNHFLFAMKLNHHIP